MITFKINGDIYTDFLDAEIVTSIDYFENQFTFTATAVDTLPPFNLGDLVECLVDDVLVATCKIENDDGEESEGSHTISYSGRDLTSDFSASQISSMSGITANISLKEMIESVLKNIGSDLKVVDNVNPKKFNKAEDKITPTDGDNCLGFVSGFARKRQCILTSTAEGDIGILSTKPDVLNATLFRRKNKDSNVLGHSWRRTNKTLFNKYIHKGQLSPSALNFAGSFDAGQVTSQGGSFVNDNIKAGRNRVVVESESYSNAQLSDRAKWTSQRAKSLATRFFATVKGHSFDGKIWKENSIVNLDFDTANIHREMLINTVTYSQAEGSATVTNLEFVEKDLHTIGGQ